jgi:hypothetical protein
MRWCAHVAQNTSNKQMAKKLQRAPTLENAYDATMAYLKMEAT